MVNWRHALEQKWTTLRFGEVKVETIEGQHIYEVQVYLGDLDSEAVRVELYADEVDGGTPVRQEMMCALVGQPAGENAGRVYRTTLPATRPATDYTARVVPHFPGVAIPLEDIRILWQR